MFSCFYYIILIYIQYVLFVFNLCSLLFYNCLFTFDVLHLYSIVKAQQNLQNDRCALLGLMRDSTVGWADRGGRYEGWGYDVDGLVDGLGWGGWDWEWGVWCWDSVGRAVDVPIQRYSTYPHLSPPNPIQH